MRSGAYPQRNMRYDVGTREINLGLVEAVVTLVAAADTRASPHVIVVGNEKGGTGKTTIAMHLAIGLLNRHRVATIDLDSRQNARDVVADFVVARIGRRFASKHASNDLISI